MSRIVFILFCVLASHTTAQAGQIFSMEKSVTYALEHSPVVQGVQIAVEQADEEIKSARGYFLPSVSAGYSYNAISSLYSKGPADSDYVDQDKAVANLRLTQTLFSGFEYISRYEKAQLGKVHQEARAAAQKLDLTLKVRTAFLELLKTRYDISIITQGITRLESDLAAARAFSNKKLAPYSQVLQAEADLEFAKQELWETKVSVFRYQERLNLLLGVPSEKSTDDSIEYHGELEKKPIDFTLPVDQCVAQAMKNRIEPRLIQIEIQMAQKDVKISKGKYYPKVSFITGIYDTDSDYDAPSISSSGQLIDRDQTNQYWDAGIYIKWDIFDGGTSYYKSKKDLLQIKKLEMDFRQVKMEVTEDVIVAHKLYHETQKRLTSSRKAIAAASENYTRQQKRFKAKLTTISDVLDAQTQLVRSESLMSQALLDYQLSMVRLNHAMGKSSE